MIQILENQLVVRGRLLRIARLDTDKYETIEDPELVLSKVKEAHARVDIFTFMQAMPDTKPLFNYHWEMDNLAILRVSTFDNWWNNQIRSYPRNRARQAEKRGVVLRRVEFDEAFARGIWEVYNESKIRQGKPNRHFGKDLATVKREAATYLDRSVFVGAYVGEQLIGFVKMILNRSRTQASLMNIVSMVSQRDKAPTNALIAHSVRACADLGIPYLMYQNYVYGSRGSDTLTTFKEINGFERVDMPRYYVPLTSLGRFALSVGLHRPLMDRLPRSITTRLRQVRTYWYNRKLSPETKTL